MSQPKNEVDFLVNPTLTLKDIESFWERLSRNPTFWSEADGSGIDGFIEGIADAEHIYVWDFGIARVVPDIPGKTAVLHLAIWGKRAMRAVNSLRAAIRDGFERTGYRRFKAFIPPHLRSYRRLVDRIGMNEIGWIPGLFKILGGSFDAIEYSISREEVFCG